MHRGFAACFRFSMGSHCCCCRHLGHPSCGLGTAVLAGVTTDRHNRPSSSREGDRVGPGKRSPPPTIDPGPWWSAMCVCLSSAPRRLISYCGSLELMSVFSGADAFRVAADMVMTARGASLRLPGALASSRVTQFGDPIIKGRNTETTVRDTT